MAEYREKLHLEPLQVFCQTALVQIAAKDSDHSVKRKKEYFGPYFLVPECFIFAEGHKITLQKISDICQNHTKSKKKLEQPEPKTPKPPKHFKTNVAAQARSTPRS
ncbi:uncharacterized protein LOC113215665 [Frankliniella occidentalis]|uniref:Uncharacterized protein LOC113215665 n=1 Tax=Frankliniella occidentalis TaxID=133901 RepID=A0A9C6XQP8_FRAOC|nr:uncharacterized protein LOC113215665 [Frankliniella occidentalis]